MTETHRMSNKKLFYEKDTKNSNTSSASHFLDEMQMTLLTAHSSKLAA
jgi:hypothetical protein